MAIRPEITLNINGKPVTFLCDSGACRTVLKTRVPNLCPSNGCIWVKSANGAVTMNRLSKPLFIKDFETGQNIKASVVISPECPINLLGRDLMEILRIAIVPTTGGMRIAHVDDDTGDLYHVDGAPPRLYYSLDLGTTHQQLILCHACCAQLTQCYLNHIIK